jgi:hypothetical protein
MKKKPTWRGANWRNDAAKFCKESEGNSRSVQRSLRESTTTQTRMVHYLDNLPRRFIPKMRRLLLRVLLEFEK